MLYFGEKLKVNYNDKNCRVIGDERSYRTANEGANAKEYWSPYSLGNATVIPTDWALEDASFSATLTAFRLSKASSELAARVFVCTAM